jgi:hypothetical protein
VAAAYPPTVFIVTTSPNAWLAPPDPSVNIGDFTFRTTTSQRCSVTIGSARVAAAAPSL